MNKFGIETIILVIIVLVNGCIQAQPRDQTTTPTSKYEDIKENIFACKYQLWGYDGKTHTICYDDKGNRLFDETYDVLIELEFSEEVINRIKENYKSGCISKIKYSEMPSSVITQFILKSELFNQKDVCVNVDNSVYSWSYNNDRYYYSISSTTGGGNFKGIYWRLNVEPYTIQGINSDMYAFLSCEDFSAHNLSWYISVNKDRNILKIVVDNVKPPVQTKDLSEEGLNKLSEDFTTCNASYSY